MRSYTALSNLYQDFTNDHTTGNIARGLGLLNDSIRTIASIKSGTWPWLQEDITLNVSTIPFIIPASVRKIINLYVTVGTQVYRPRPINSSDQWNRLLSANLGTSNTPQFYYVQGNQILFLPALTPDIGSTLTYRARKRASDIGNPDYSAGTVSGFTQGSTTVTGSNTGWTSNMVGRYIQIPTTEGGDGLWYQIAAVVSATQITLATPYEGVSIGTVIAAPFVTSFSVTNTGTIPVGTYTYVVTAIDEYGNESAVSNSNGAMFTSANGQVVLVWNPVSNAVSYNVYRSTTAGVYTNAVVANTTATTYTDTGANTNTGTPNSGVSYTIGEMSVIPEQYDMAPVYRATALYWMTKDNAKSNQYWKLYDGGMEAGLRDTVGGLVAQMMEDTGESTEGAYISPDDGYFVDPNIPPRAPINQAGGWGT